MEKRNKNRQSMKPLKSSIDIPALPKLNKGHKVNFTNIVEATETSKNGHNRRVSAFDLYSLLEMQINAISLLTCR